MDKTQTTVVSSSTRLPLVGVRLYPHERRGLEAVAARDGVTLSDVMRKALALYISEQKESARI